MVELRWVSRGLVIATIDGRSIHIGGEAMLNRDPDYLIYPESVTAWEDGTPVDPERRAAILDDVVAAAAGRGWTFQVSSLP